MVSGEYTHFQLFCEHARISPSEWRHMWGGEMKMIRGTDVLTSSHQQCLNHLLWELVLRVVEFYFWLAVEIHVKHKPSFSQFWAQLQVLLLMNGVVLAKRHHWDLMSSSVKWRRWYMSPRTLVKIKWDKWAEKYLAESKCRIDVPSVPFLTGVWVCIQQNTLLGRGPWLSPFVSE